MPTVIKMRSTRVAQYDAGGKDMLELALATTDRDGQQLDPDNVQSASFSGNFVAPFGAEIAHDSLIDVTITISTPAA